MGTNCAPLVADLFLFCLWERLHVVYEPIKLHLQIFIDDQGSKNPLVRSYLRVPQAAGQVKIWMIFNVN